MESYKDQVKKEATAFYKAALAEFEDDAEEFGGKSAAPNLAKWIDRTGKLSTRAQEISAKWGHKDILWVQSNTRNPSPHGGGDPRSNAFASFLQDIRQEIKKLDKGRRKR
jgi:hypothetical protein